MQKLLRRTQLVKRQAARRKAADREKQAADNRKLQLRNTVESYKPIRELRRASQLTRQEDWLLGPLAPKRDVGDQESTYGALPSSAAFFPKKPADKIKDWGIVEGDRVVIIQDGHPDQGRIGKVKTVEKEQETVTIDGFNLVRVITNSTLFNVYSGTVELTFFARLIFESKTLIL
jgi:large subunit ribosomal protein L24